MQNSNRAHFPASKSMRICRQSEIDEAAEGVGAPETGIAGCQFLQWAGHIKITRPTN